MRVCAVVRITTSFCDLRSDIVLPRTLQSSQNIVSTVKICRPIQRRCCAGLMLFSTGTKRAFRSARLSGRRSGPAAHVGEIIMGMRCGMQLLHAAERIIRSWCSPKNCCRSGSGLRGSCCAGY